VPGWKASARQARSWYSWLRYSWSLRACRRASALRPSAAEPRVRLVRVLVALGRQPDALAAAREGALALRAAGRPAEAELLEAEARKLEQR